MSAPSPSAPLPTGASLLDDQPAAAGGDRLRFARYIETIDELVLQRESEKVLVTAIYGPWGSGKSSLLALLKHRLEAINAQAEAERAALGEAAWTGRAAPSDRRSADEVRRDTERFKVVEFSPWLYRNEKSLMVPLLATLAKRHTEFQNLLGDILQAAPGLVRQVVETAGKLALAGTEMAVSGLPLLTFLTDLNARAKERNKDKGAIKELTEKIEAAVKKTVKGNQRIVFLIDDLDRCHDPAQVVGLLEQIKLLLHLDRCLFFIAADRQQIIAAIEKLFPGAGRNYLEKFIQLGVELAPHGPDDLVELVPASLPAPERAWFRRLAAVIGNPRQFKQVLNQAVLLKRLAGKHIDSALTLSLNHQPDLILAAKCVVLRELTAFAGADGRARYLGFESGARDEAARKGFYAAVVPKPAPAPAKDDTAQALQALALSIAARRAAPVAAPAPSLAPAQHALAAFLWLDMKTHRFESARVLGLYASLDGEGQQASRQEIELAVSEGQVRFENRHFGLEDFRQAELGGAAFVNCEFDGTLMQEASLEGASFERCTFNRVNLSLARVDGSRWQFCQGLDTINADAATSAKLVMQWAEQGGAASAAAKP